MRTETGNSGHMAGVQYQGNEANDNHVWCGLPLDMKEPRNPTQKYKERISFVSNKLWHIYRLST